MATYEEKKQAALAAMQASQQDGPSEAEAFGRGAAQGATFGFGDEVGGAIQAGLGAVLPESMGGYGADDKRSFTQRYRDERDAFHRENEAARGAHGGWYGGGQVAGGLLTTPLVPGASSANLGRVVASSAAAGGAMGLGDSEADLTRGDIKGAADDVASGVGAGAVFGAAGAGVAAVVRKGAQLASRLGGDRLIKGLTQYMDNITNRGGSPEARKAAAGKMMEHAIEVAGDERVPAENFRQLADELAKSSQNPFRKGLDPVTEEVVASAERLAGGKGATLAELDQGFKYWTKQAEKFRPTETVAGDPAAYEIAKRAKDALQKELEAAHPALGKAAEIYASGRAAYSKAAAADDLASVLMGAKDVTSAGGKMMNPRQFAAANSGKKAEEVNRLLGQLGDPDAAEAWQAGVEAARVLAKKGVGWAPRQLVDLSPKAAEGLESLMKGRNVVKVFSDPDLAKDYLSLVNPSRPIKTETALAIVSRMSTRLAENEDTAAVRAAEREQRPSVRRYAAAGEEPGFIMDPTNLQAGYQPASVPRRP